ncbi:Acb2/Tad1 domain-containing protein [Nocardia asiatica]
MSYHNPNSSADIGHRFNYHPPSGDKITAHEQTRAACRELAHQFDRDLPPGREKSLALTKLEEAMFWANAAIARAEN